MPRAAPVGAKSFAAARRAWELESEGFGQVHFFARQRLQLVAQEDELHLVRCAVAREDAVPLAAGLGLQFPEDGEGGGLDPPANVPGEERVEAAAGREAQPKPGHDHEHQQVGGEPDQDLGGEGKAGIHGSSGRISM